MYKDDPIGTPALLRPGQSAWFAGLYDDAQAIKIRLSDLPPEVTSFHLDRQHHRIRPRTHLGVPQPVEPWKRELYRLDQLDLTIANSLGSSGEGGYEVYQQRLLDHYVEIQLWSDEPVRHHLRR